MIEKPNKLDTRCGRCRHLDTEGVPARADPVLYYLYCTKTKRNMMGFWADRVHRGRHCFKPATGTSRIKVKV